MQRNKIIIWATFILTLVVCLVGLTLPVPASWESLSTSFHQQLVFNVIMAFFHTGGAILFLTNLDVYKSQLRRAYTIMALGTLVTGLGTLQITLIIILDAWQTAYARSGITMVPFILTGILLYFGVRAFARTVGTKHILTHGWVVLPTSIGLAIAAATLLPHIAGRIPEATLRALVGIDTWSGSLLLLTGMLVWVVRKHAGAHYTSAMTWLGRALFIASTVLIYQGFYSYINSDNIWYMDIISNGLVVLSGWFWVRAGYAFALTKYYNEDIPLRYFLFTSATQKSTNRAKTAVDMVTSTASLVSNSADIDPLLDDVRAITSKLKPGDKLSETDTRSLVATYLKLEQYLITRERIRAYKKQELRAQLDPTLQKLVIAQETKLT